MRNNVIPITPRTVEDARRDLQRELQLQVDRAKLAHEWCNEALQKAEEIKARLATLPQE